MGSGRGWLGGDWPSTGCVLNITAAAWTAGFHGGVLATKSERKMLASTCLYSPYAWFLMYSSRQTYRHAHHITSHFYRNKVTYNDDENVVHHHHHHHHIETSRSTAHGAQVV